ncbi:hypothetical protein MASR2M44_21930 [Bacteroidota bacterium]
MISLTKAECQSRSKKKLFGLCDNPHPAKDPAYIDENNGENWIAVVVNEPLFDVVFTAVDHCIDSRRDDGKMIKRCDGILHYAKTVIFVELKERSSLGNDWVKDAEIQLKSSIEDFEKNIDPGDFNFKRAYIANNKHPRFKETQTNRMNRFEKETGYVLRIENRIILS